MKIHRSIFAIAIAVIMLCIAFNPPIASAEVYPARSTKVLVLCDESYRAYLKSSYGEYNSDIVVQLMKLAARPFSNVWNDGLDVTVASYENIIVLPILLYLLLIVAIISGTGILMITVTVTENGLISKHVIAHLTDYALAEQADIITQAHSQFWMQYNNTTLTAQLMMLLLQLLDINFVIPSEKIMLIGTNSVAE